MQIIGWVIAVIALSLIANFVYYYTTLPRPSV